MLTGNEKLHEMKEARNFVAKEIRRRRNCFVGIDLPKEVKTMLRDDLKALIGRSSHPKPTLKNLMKRARMGYDEYLGRDWLTEAGRLDTEYYSACGHADYVYEMREAMRDDARECVLAAKEIINA